MRTRALEDPLIIKAEREIKKERLIDLTRREWKMCLYGFLKMHSHKKKKDK